MQTDDATRRDDDAYGAAQKRAEELQGFCIHLLVYVVVNLRPFLIPFTYRWVARTEWKTTGAPARIDQTDWLWHRVAA